MEVTADKFYERLDYWIDKKDISVYKLGKISKVSSSTIYNGKKGNRHVSIETLEKLLMH